MTRNFSNQRRDGMRPSSRNSASGRYREEPSSRPARPRLSRDAVDRAWENGATRSYADYHPRQNPPTSPAQRQGRPAPAYERSRQPQNRRPYETSQEPYGSSRPFARSGGDYQPRQHTNDGPRRFDRSGYRAPGGQAGPNSERWTRGSAPQGPRGYTEHRSEHQPPRFRQDGPHATDRGSQRAPRFQQDGPQYGNANRPPRFQQDEGSDYRGSQRPARFRQDDPHATYRGINRPPRFRQDGPRPTYRGTSQGRPFERTEHAREQFAHGQHGRGQETRRDNYNPRWQSRPGPQRDYTRQQRDFQAPWQNPDQEQRPGQAQFEGDYERFNDYEHTSPREFAPQAERPAPAYERPVTRLPDGRILKGSRPSQRRQAAFWQDVESETGEILSQATPPQKHDTAPQTRPAPRPARPRKPAASSVRKVKTARAEDAKPHTAKVARKNAQGPHKPVTRPSHRGYKWPTPGEQAGNSE